MTIKQQALEDQPLISKVSPFGKIIAALSLTKHHFYFPHSFVQQNNSAYHVAAQSQYCQDTGFNLHLF